VCGDCDLSDAFHGVRVARCARTAHVAEGSLHGLDGARYVDADHPIGAVRDAADQAVAMYGLGHTRMVNHALDATARKAVPVHQRGDGI
jgi:hypothetical protein